MQELKEIKKAARRAIRAQIASLDEKELEKSDEAIYNNLSVLPELQSARRVFLYWSVRREVDTHLLLKSLLEQGKTAALPVSLSDGQMFFAQYRPGSLTDGSVVPIPEPDGDAPRLEPEAGDLILVPALTFDLNGFRLGQGGGYYDRFLSAHDLFSVGLARDRLLLEEVPREAHDCAVRCLVTESRVLRF
jgi:5-formyltetrahydrofolate cyclo-ligase